MSFRDSPARLRNSSATPKKHCPALLGEKDMSKKKKVRVELRKNRSKPPRERQWTRGFHEHGFEEQATAGGERVRAKGDLSRHRTIVQDEGTTAGAPSSESVEMPSVDLSCCVLG